MKYLGVALIYYINRIKLISYGTVRHWFPFSYWTPPFSNFGQWVYRKLLQYESVIKETHNEFIAKSVFDQKEVENKYSNADIFSSELNWPIFYYLPHSVHLYGGNVVMFKVLHSFPWDLYGCSLCIFDWFSCIVWVNASILQYNKCDYWIYLHKNCAL